MQSEKQIVSAEWARGYQAAADLVAHYENSRAGFPSIITCCVSSPYDLLQKWAAGFRVASSSEENDE